MGFKKNNCLFLGKPIVILWQYGTILVIKDFSNKNLSRREYVILSKRMWSQKSQIHDIMRAMSQVTYLVNAIGSWTIPMSK